MHMCVWRARYEMRQTCGLQIGCTPAAAAAPGRLRHRAYVASAASRGQGHAEAPRCTLDPPPADDRRRMMTAAFVAPASARQLRQQQWQRKQKECWLAHRQWASAAWTGQHRSGRLDVMRSSSLMQHSPVLEHAVAKELSTPGGGCSTAVPRPAAPGVACG